MKIPRLGQNVYIVYNERCIVLAEVYMKGKDAFCIEDSFSDLFIESVRKPIYYNQYNENWFTSFTNAKNKVLNGHNKIVKLYEGYWNVEEV